jgi:hypothetical protein
MNGTSIANQGYVAIGVSPAWQMVGLGDFNGDGFEDLLWYNPTTGDVYLWEMDGLNIVNQGYVATGVALSLKIVAP